MTETLEIHSLDGLAVAAERIIARLAERPVVALYGEMGAGKTTLVREIARLSGVRQEVTSPTFALVNQYVTGCGEILDHFDFYRIERIEEAFDMGYEEYFYSGDVCLVEWPEKISGLLPDNALIVRISVTGPESRTITIK
ncbi:MAG: tRNA (adenosine(37)-N6)-threonylcarbamoyltransferase complex ATPase subunit type 1 TsaE [Rikenellaceae bacterium]|jgi:tRNA threonylcarbamoyladenosine biosynthesis protein TsaE|nr:tRNA (adenosine(37)-N6)-threonylcarbamoyltransferase complex ATPase subunit type 1 TsaE [Rikenellaceae bacterium]